MRLNNRVTLVSESKGEYNAQTGNIESDEVHREIVPARINDMSDKRMNFLFGKLQSQAYTLIFIGSELNDASYVEINGEPYTITRTRQLRNKFTMDVVAR